MDLLKLIKERKTIRKYKNKLIPKQAIDKIIEAGIWGPSVHGFQPWKFIIVRNELRIKEIAHLLIKKSQKIDIAARILLRSSADVISNSKILIVVCNQQSFSKWASRFKKEYGKYAKLAELSAISAAIQNMTLVAHRLRIGHCWLDAPLFCEKQISKLLNTRNKLAAILSLGYSDEKSKRSKRKQISQSVSYIG